MASNLKLERMYLWMKRVKYSHWNPTEIEGNVVAKKARKIGKTMNFGIEIKILWERKVSESQKKVKIINGKAALLLLCPLAASALFWVNPIYPIHHRQMPSTGSAAKANWLITFVHISGPMNEFINRNGKICVSEKVHLGMPKKENINFKGWTGCQQKS